MTFQQQIEGLTYVLDELYEQKAALGSDATPDWLVRAIQASEAAIESIAELEEIHSYKAACLCEGCR